MRYSFEPSYAKSLELDIMHGFAIKERHDFSVMMKIIPLEKDETIAQGGSRKNVEDCSSRNTILWSIFNHK